jgi:SRSO17 transposase
VIDHVAQDVNELLGDEQNTALLIDGSRFIKQEKESVGVSRQWMGRLGKADNEQVAVFGALANGQFTATVDVRLYLPKEWTNDPNRC